MPLGVSFQFRAIFPFLQGNCPRQTREGSVMLYQVAFPPGYSRPGRYSSGHLTSAKPIRLSVGSNLGFEWRHTERGSLGTDSSQWQHLGDKVCRFLLPRFQPSTWLFTSFPDFGSCLSILSINYPFSTQPETVSLLQPKEWELLYRLWQRILMYEMPATPKDRRIKMDSLYKTGQYFHRGHTGDLDFQIKKQET